MIDIHCHILPSLDDGAGSEAETLKMATLAAKNGIKRIIATPHCYDGVFNCECHDIVALVEKLNDSLRQHRVGIEVLPGAEIRLTPDVLTLVKESKVVTLGGTGKYILLELPEFFIPEGVSGVVEELSFIGVKAIIAHPERNRMIHTHPSSINVLAEAGAEFQITADSLLGNFGKNIKEKSVEILQMETRCYLASDAHSSKRRKPLLSKAVRLAGKLVGTENVEKLVTIDLLGNKEMSAKFAYC